MDLHKVSLGKGKSWSITLPGLGSAGYVWEYRVEGKVGVISLVSELTGGPQLPPAGSEPPPGYSKDEIFTVTGLRPGNVRVVLVQRRPWETDTPPFREVVLEVEVAK